MCENYLANYLLSHRDSLCFQDFHTLAYSSSIKNSSAASLKNLQCENFHDNHAHSFCCLCNHNDNFSPKTSIKNPSISAEHFVQQIDTAIDRFRTRAQSVPEISIPEDLPIFEQRDTIISLLRTHQVIIIAGETGSGKSTQLPKIALAAGYGIKGMIGLTQPRKIAAYAIADRLKEELNVSEDPQDHRIGCCVRFSDRTDEHTLIKVMTDGILLAEIAHNPMLYNYDLIIIDEAHERTINIDFLLGYISTILPHRPELRLVITSATVNIDAIAKFFTAHKCPPAILSVKGRTYPVEIRYRPPEITHGNPQPCGDIIAAINELQLEDAGRPKGDILIFFAREYEIRHAQEKLAGHAIGTTYDIIPLYARLPLKKQHMIFEYGAKPRIILATNVAETSITVPRVRYVIDTGTARIARYSTRTKVMRLPIEPISQASAIQRSGRCGRTEPGIAIRLYDEASFSSREVFCEPEITRTNLSSVILHMGKLRFAPIVDFPFINRPKDRVLQEAVQNLIDLGALPEGSTIFDQHIKLTDYGKILAQLPIDPRLGRMLIAAREYGALEDVIIIVAALSVGNIRLSTEFREDTQALYEPFINRKSDFLFILNIYRYLEPIYEGKTHKRFTQELNNLGLHITRVREWFGLIKQLHKNIEHLHWPIEKEPSTLPTIHRSLLAGVLPNVGTLKEITHSENSPHSFSESHQPYEYQGIKSLSFSISPSSVLYKKPPSWIMAFELVETSKTYAFTCGTIEPEWIEEYTQNSCRKTHTNIRWNKNRGEVVAMEKVFYQGLPIVNNRIVSYGKIDPQKSRELFIYHALISQDTKNEYPFSEPNKNTMHLAEAIGNKLRSHAVVIDTDNLYKFFTNKIPDGIATCAAFEHWYQQQDNPHLLEFSLEDSIGESSLDRESIDQLYPDFWKQGAIELPLEYVFDPGASNDGIQVIIPVKLLPFISPHGFDWTIPGYREELIYTFFQLLPKNYRRQLGSPQDAAEEFCQNYAQYIPRVAQLSSQTSFTHESSVYPPSHTPHTPTTNLGIFAVPEEKLVPSIAQFCATKINDSYKNIVHCLETIYTDKLPSWLKITFTIIDIHKNVLATSENLRETQSICKSFTTPVLISPIRQWTDTSTIPECKPTETVTIDSYQFSGYNAIRYYDQKMRINTYSHKKMAEKVHQRSLISLIKEELLATAKKTANKRQEYPFSIQALSKIGLSPEQYLLLKTYPQLDTLIDDALNATILAYLVPNHSHYLDIPLPYTPQEYNTLLASIKKRCRKDFIEIIHYAANAIESWSQTQLLCSPYCQGSGDICDIARSIEHHRQNILSDHFINNTPLPYLSRLATYGQSEYLRFENLLQRPEESTVVKDHQKTATISEIEQSFANKIKDPIAQKTHPIHWLIEELKVSLYSQKLGTITPVSPKKIISLLNE